MARLLDAGPALIVSREAEKQEIIQWYRDSLDATTPPEGLTWEPVKIGPTWQWSLESGWALPKATLGWDMLAWAGMWLSHKGKPWVYTMEQARFLLWFYAVVDSGDFESHSAVLQRMKGWGKDPVAATLAPMEMVGPVRFSHWDGDRPVGREEPNAWVQLTAVSQEQTKNTMKLMPGLIPAETRLRYGFQIGKLSLWAMGDTRQTEAVTSSPLALEGGRPTLIVRNETQNWNSSNGGHDMDGALEGNAAKRDIDAPARILDICNAYRPGEDSVGERTRLAWEGTLGDVDSEEAHERPKYMDFGLLYDSLEAPPEAPILNPDTIPEVIESIRGDAVWLDTRPGGRIMKSILNPRNPQSESRRKWYNQITAREDAFTTPQLWDSMGRDDLVLEQGEQIALFLDCSKSDDATALVACRISDGALFVLGMWQRPPGKRGETWTVPREKVDAAVRSAAENFRLVGFWVDPGHALEDESKERFWDGLIDRWHRTMGRRLKMWARRGKQGHSTMFDMAEYANQKMFVEAVSFAEADIEAGLLIHDKDARLRHHMLNAVRMPTRAGLSIGKEHRESRRKIDLAVAAIGARMIRREYLNSNQRRGGRVL